MLDPVWDMYAYIIKLRGRTATLLERDDRIPTIDEVHVEVLKANKFIENKTSALTAG